MGMKAEKGRVIERQGSKSKDPKPGDGYKDREEVEFPEREIRPLSGEGDEDPNPDELIMVMMPRATWDAFEVLAAAHGGSAAQAMSTALKLLEEALKSAKVEKSDGA